MIIFMHIKEWEDLISTSNWKQKSRGLHTTVVPLTLFSDDVSGNASKKWNNLMCGQCCLLVCQEVTTANLKISILAITASNRVNCLKLAEPIVDDLLVLF